MTLIERGPESRSERGVQSGAAAEPHSAFPSQPLLHLDAVWIQIAGTLCNLSCSHCFVSSGPGVDRHGLLSRAVVASHVADSLALGAKEFYLTGGEPFVHPELLAIVADILVSAPVTVLTNGTLITRARAAALARLASAARYSLEIRVSLDGLDAGTHDAFRGVGAFDRAMAGLRRLTDAGLLPIVTFTHDGDDRDAFASAAIAMLHSAGFTRPRIKVMPMFRLGREVVRTGAYSPVESLAGVPDGSFDPWRLQCYTCRAVTSQGVFVCPLLVDEPGARMGARVGEALGPFTLSHGACVTCWRTGMTCANG